MDLEGDPSVSEESHPQLGCPFLLKVANSIRRGFLTGVVVRESKAQSPCSVNGSLDYDFYYFKEETFLEMYLQNADGVSGGQICSLTCALLQLFRTL